MVARPDSGRPGRIPSTRIPAPSDPTGKLPLRLDRTNEFPETRDSYIRPDPPVRADAAPPTLDHSPPRRRIDSDEPARRSSDPPAALGPSTGPRGRSGSP